MSYEDVYVSGIYTADPEEGFALDIIRDGGVQPKLAFTAVRGRTYTVQAAANLGEWQDVSMRVLPLDPHKAPQAAYHATSTKRVEIAAPELPGGPARFFRLLVH